MEPSMISPPISGGITFPLPIILNIPQLQQVIAILDHLKEIIQMFFTGACVSHAVSMTKYLGSDALDYSVTFKQGESRIEPNFTPARDLKVYWKTFSQFAYECGQSRLWAGVHFQARIK